MEHPTLVLDFITKPLSHFVEHVFTLTDSNHLTHVGFTWLYMLLLILIAIPIARNPRLIPGKLQNVLETIVDLLRNLIINTMGKEGLRFFPLMATIAIFILVANLGGVIPGFYSPTSNMNTNAAIALVVFFLTHIVGIKVHGAAYLKQFVGPVWWLAPLMIPIELIGHFARPVSLTMRLFGNIMGEDLVLMVLLALVPFLLPVPMLFLMIFTSVLQAFVFMLLAMMYISGAMSEAH